MKIETCPNGRRIYKYSHSVALGGNVYIHKTLQGKIIGNKPGLRNALNATAKRFSLIDPTIKIYDNIFFFFFHVPKSLAPAELIESIQRNISNFSEWEEDYVFTGVYDLQERFVRKDLEKWGFGYDKG
jgi:hypothetical protein